ncbi:glycosyltransferase [Motiliproteus sediminis]|uniref:glycosyltransferase n=1 Tax=Motiliproteus sediminis TaxID=1468178 RepID=UPI001AEF51F2|nr:glycosyltransferase [Motiliproteus sediminis]
MKRPLVVFSAVGLNQGGTLSVAHDVLSAADKRDDVRCIAFVNKRSLYPRYRRVKLLEVQWPKRSWFLRLFFEFVASYRLSLRLNAEAWFALHDISPRVKTPRQYVYCHNPTPFYKAGWRDLVFQPTVFVFALFYRYLYRLNITANAAVFVQQSHIRDYFLVRYSAKRVVVARPASTGGAVAAYTRQHAQEGDGDNTVRLLYPTLPRSFKNIEHLIKAAAALEGLGVRGFEIRITVSEKDSLYARYLIWSARRIESIRFLGRLTREQVESEYAACDALVFPSKLETWGLPLTEAKFHGLPILAADLPYAKETLGQYARVSFFDPGDAQQLADRIRELISGTLRFEGSNFVMPDNTPVVNGWDDLIRYVVDGK